MTADPARSRRAVSERLSIEARNFFMTWVSCGWHRESPTDPKSIFSGLVGAPI
jgi:hypothetical protein